MQILSLKGFKYSSLFKKMYIHKVFVLATHKEKKKYK